MISFAFSQFHQHRNYKFFTEYLCLSAPWFQQRKLFLSCEIFHIWGIIRPFQIWIRNRKFLATTSVDRLRHGRTRIFCFMISNFTNCSVWLFCLMRRLESIMYKYCFASSAIVFSCSTFVGAAQLLKAYLTSSIISSNLTFTGTIRFPNALPLFLDWVGLLFVDFDGNRLVWSAWRDADSLALLASWINKM